MARRQISSSWNKRSDIDRRKSIKKAAQPKRRLRFFGLLLLAIVFYIIFVSDFFSIKNINLVGSRFVPLDAVRQTAESQMTRERYFFLSQQNIFLFHKADFAHGVKGGRIQDVQVTKVFPNTLKVRIIEKVPKAVWLSGSRIYEIDETGTIIGELASIDQEDDRLQLVDSSQVNVSKSVGEQVVDPYVIEKAHQLDAAMPEVLQQLVLDYDVSTIDEQMLVARMHDGWDLRMSLRLDTDLQMEKLRIFLHEKKQQNEKWLQEVQYIDIRFGNSRVYYR